MSNLILILLWNVYYTYRTLFLLFSQREELFVLSNDLDKNTLRGESSKSGCDVLEFYYSSTCDAIHRAPTNVLRKKIIHT